MLGRTETRTRDRMYCQTIRTVRDISRDDRARIATCCLRTPTDRQTDRQTDRRKENYSIDDAWYAGWNNMMETKKIMANIGIYVAEWTNNLSNMEILWKGRKAA